MAERRMFAKTIIDSDAFIDMPLSTQALYFHLAMRVNKEGYLSNVKAIAGAIGASQCDIDLLYDRSYLEDIDIDYYTTKIKDGWNGGKK